MQSIKSNKPRSKVKLLIIATIILLVIAGGATAYIYIAKPFNKTQSGGGEMRPVNDISYTPATSDEKTDSENAKKAIVESEKTTPTSSDISVTISRAGKTNGVVAVRTVINGATTGSCTLTFTKSGTTVTKNATVSLSVNTYVCNADVPVSDFSSTGSWQLSVIANNGSAASQPATQTVDL